MQLTRYLTTAAILFGCLIGGYYALFRYQFGAPLAAEYWVEDVMEAKQRLAERQPSPRMLLVGGSAGFWGFDSAILERAAGVPVTNLCLHAGLRFDTYTANVKEALRRGDRLLLQLEYGFFNRDTTDKPNEWLTHQAMTWFPEFFDDLSPAGRLRFFLSVTPARVLSGAIAKTRGAAVLDRFPQRRPRSIELAFADGSAMTLAAGHDHPRTRNLDHRGDLVDIEEEADLPEVIRYAIKGLRKRRELPAPIGALLADAREREIPVYFVFPPIMKVPTSDFSLPKVRAGGDRVRELLEREGVVVLGDPEGSQYPGALFANTTYHLNRRGRAHHSTRVAAMLRRALESSSGESAVRSAPAVSRVGSGARPGDAEVVEAHH